VSTNYLHHQEANSGLDLYQNCLIYS